jgi:hypothetical protein
MGYVLLADLVVLLHLLFVVFVLFGGLLVAKARRLVWIHGPAFAWGFLVEVTGWTCPLTPLENWLRVQGADSAYDGDFLSHWLLPLLYPSFLTHHIQIVLGTLVLAVNAVIYAWILRRRRDEANADQRGGG